MPAPPINTAKRKYQWILWSMTLFLVAIGGLCLYSSFNTPESKPEAAAELRGLAIWSICFASAVVAIERATTTLFDNEDQNNTQE